MLIRISESKYKGREYKKVRMCKAKIKWNEPEFMEGDERNKKKTTKNDHFIWKKGNHFLWFKTKKYPLDPELFKLEIDGKLKKLDRKRNWIFQKIKQMLYIVGVIHKAFCLNVTQDYMYGVSNETRIPSCMFASLAC